jgi:hypothetical protein
MSSLDMALVVTVEGDIMPSVSVWRSRMLLNILLHIGTPPTKRFISPQVSAVLRPPEFMHFVNLDCSSQ